MRSFSFVVFLCAATVCFSQRAQNIHPDFRRHIDTLILEANKRGYIDFKERIDANLGSMYYFQEIFHIFNDETGALEDSFLDSSRLGISYKAQRSIHINDVIRNNPIKLKITVWHEIGHIVKQNFFSIHQCKECYEIFSEVNPQDLSPYLDEEFMKRRLDNYFKFVYGFGYITLP